jgi:hypothetical protein
MFAKHYATHGHYSDPSVGIGSAVTVPLVISPGTSHDGVTLQSANGTTVMPGMTPRLTSQPVMPAQYTQYELPFSHHFWKQVTGVGAIVVMTSPPSVILAGSVNVTTASATLGPSVLAGADVSAGSARALTVERPARAKRDLARIMASGVVMRNRRLVRFNKPDADESCE